MAEERPRKRCGVTLKEGLGGKKERVEEHVERSELERGGQNYQGDRDHESSQKIFNVDIPKNRSQKRDQKQVHKAVRHHSSCKYNFACKAVLKCRPKSAVKQGRKDTKTSAGKGKTNASETRNVGSQRPASSCVNVSDENAIADGADNGTPWTWDDNDILMDGSGLLEESSAKEITSLESYIHFLRQHQVIVPYNQSLLDFVLQDFCPSETTLKPYSYHFVSRVAKIMDGEPQWVYWCSCNRERADLIDSINFKVAVSLDVFESSMQECLHISAAKQILSSVDSAYAVSPAMEFMDHTYSSDHIGALPEFTVIGSSGAICIHGDTKTPGVVCLTEQGIRCTSCRYNKASCEHIQQLMAIVQSCLNDIPPALKPFADVASPQQIQQKVSPKPKCFSAQKLSFDPSDVSVAALQEAPCIRFNLHEGMSQLVPDRDSSHTCPVCNCADCWTEEVYLLSEGHLITSNQMYPMKVYYRKCNTPNCVGELHYDGKTMSLINMKSFVVAHEVLRSFMFHFLHGRMTLYCEYQTLVDMHRDAGHIEFSGIFSYQHFRSSWYSYLGLLDIDFNDGFCCPDCGGQPTTVIMDATALSFRKELDTWQKTLQTESASKQSLKAGR